MITRPYGRSTTRIQSDYTFWWPRPFGKGENDLAIARVRHSLGILLSWTIRKRLHLQKITQVQLEPYWELESIITETGLTRNSSRTEHEARMNFKRAWRLITSVTRPLDMLKRSTDVLTKP